MTSVDLILNVWLLVMWLLMYKKSLLILLLRSVLRKYSISNIILFPPSEFFKSFKVMNILLLRIRSIAYKAYDITVHGVPWGVYMMSIWRVQYTPSNEIQSFSTCRLMLYLAERNWKSTIPFSQQSIGVQLVGVTCISSFFSFYRQMF